MTGASVSQNNSMVLGSINGVNQSTADTNVGIGTTAPAYRLHVIDPANQGFRIQTNTPGGIVASFGGNGEFQIDGFGLAGGRLKVLENGNVGIGMPSGSNVNNKLDVVGTIGVWTLGSGGSVPLCWHTGGYNLSTCGSSLCYKKNQRPFTSGLNLLTKLQPMEFDWKEGGVHDLGLGAEDVEKIEPLLVTYNTSGQVEGVKYDRIGVVLVNAVKEQQAQIEALQQRIDRQSAEIEQLRKKGGELDELKAFMCGQTPEAPYCMPRK